MYTNDKEFKELSLSRQVATKGIYESFKILKKEGGKLAGKEIIDRLRETVEFTDWEKERYEKTGYIRWECILHFFTIDCVKAGYLRKQKGVWHLTEEGEKAMEMGPVKMLNTATAKYRIWEKEKAQFESEQKHVSEENELSDKEQSHKAKLDLLEADAISGIKEHINDKNPYEFQDLVAALLRAMKYHTPFISPKGKDGGIDVVAYQDPLGAKSPRIKVQVKHRPDASIPVSDIRSLTGVLSKDGDIGLFVTSGTFSAEAERFARDSHIHVKLIDIDSFIELWQEYYENLGDEEKNMLPLTPIYFLGTND